VKVHFYRTEEPRTSSCDECQRPRDIRLEFKSGKVISLCWRHHNKLLDLIDMGGRA